MSATTTTSTSLLGTGAGVEALREACDRLVESAADPAAARAVVVAVWALGAASTDHLLDDLCAAAATGAARTGAPVDAGDLLDLLGRHEAASRLRGAVERGLAAHAEAAQEAARADRAVLAARAAVRIAATAQHRRTAARAA
ncbi:hypothetical protein [Quadrisphaera setariae]|uniref:Uncharacterized protein n=1 Tax=Quadrisphaera setariae TaxID=2593304 RepID=A0A5C8ZGU3_9ACTN|nr:hypothetical protein [Quadrisphaera setariae]TXR56106.1 hypothetical protein FMM08_11785 [Quadrisphaera setariae]